MRETGQVLARLRNDESGISSVEYALLLAVVAPDALSEAVQGEMSNAGDCIATGDTTNPTCP